MKNQGAKAESLYRIQKRTVKQTLEIKKSNIINPGSYINMTGHVHKCQASAQTHINCKMSESRPRMLLRKCPICLGDIEQNDRASPILVTGPRWGCKHEFHFECLRAWFHEKVSKGYTPVCPDCRQAYTGLYRPLPPIHCNLCRLLLTSKETFCMLPCGHYVCYNDDDHKAVLAVGNCDECERPFDEVECNDGQTIKVADLLQSVMPPEETGAAVGNDDAAPGQMNDVYTLPAEELRRWGLLGYQPIEGNGAAAGGMPPANARDQFDDSIGAGHGPASMVAESNGAAGDPRPPSGLRRHNARSWNSAGREDAAAESNGAAGGYQAPKRQRQGDEMSQNPAGQEGAAAESNGAAGGYQAPEPQRQEDEMSQHSAGQEGAAAESNGAAGGYPAPNPERREDEVITVEMRFMVVNGIVILFDD